MCSLGMLWFAIAKAFDNTGEMIGRITKDRMEFLAAIMTTEGKNISLNNSIICHNDNSIYPIAHAVNFTAISGMDMRANK